MDIYDALRVHRHYRPRIAEARALAILRSEAERSALDPAVVAVLAQCQHRIEHACAPLRPA